MRMRTALTARCGPAIMLLAALAAVPADVQ
jgi:hypothetical protein